MCRKWHNHRPHLDPWYPEVANLLNQHFFVGPDLDLIQTVRQVISRQHYLEINLFSKKKTCPARSGSELFAGNQQTTLLGNEHFLAGLIWVQPVCREFADI